MIAITIIQLHYWGMKKAMKIGENQEWLKISISIKLYLQDTRWIGLDHASVCCFALFQERELYNEDSLTLFSNQHPLIAP